MSKRTDADRKHRHVSQVRPSGDRANADGRLPVLLRLQGVRRTAQAVAGRLLRVLLIRFGAVPIDSDRTLLLVIFAIVIRAGPFDSRAILRSAALGQE